MQCVLSEPSWIYKHSIILTLDTRLISTEPLSSHWNDLPKANKLRHSAHDTETVVALHLNAERQDRRL